MGRYSVPQYDHDDDGDNNNDDPMEWEDLVADNNHNDHHNINNGNGNRNGGNIYNSNLNDIGSKLQDMSMHNDNHHHSRQSSASGVSHSADANIYTNGHHEHEREHEDDHDHAPSSTYDNNSHTSNQRQNQATLQLMAEQCTNMNPYQSNQYNMNMMEQEVAQLQKSTKRKRRIIQTFAIILVAIVSIVLKRYAPPPPPIASVLNLNVKHHGDYPSTLKEVFSSFSADTATDKSHTNNNELEDDDNKVIQHEHEHVQYETWADYSKHVFHLVHHATVYGMSVGWYTISNSFKYAIDEARDKFVSNDARDTNVNNVGMLNMNMNLGIGVKDALISFCNTVRQSLGMQYTTTATYTADNHIYNHPQSQSKSDDDTDTAKQKPSDSDNNNEATASSSCSTTCPIHIPSTKNHKIPWFTTEDFLRQTIGSSLSPQNLALKVIATSLDAWGRTSEEEGAPIDTATDTDNILPPAIGFLLVGSTGVGKLHTARRMAHLLLGHCVPYNTTDDGGGVASVEEEELDGLLEVIAREDGAQQRQQHSVKDQIVNHLLRRKGFGSVIILHHIERLLPRDILPELSLVLSGKSDTLTYFTPSSEGDNNALVKKEVSCNGTVFLLTSKQWGSETILRHIRSNDGLINGLNRDTLVSSVEEEVDSHFLDDDDDGGMKKFANVSAGDHLPMSLFSPEQLY